MLLSKNIICLHLITSNILLVKYIQFTFHVNTVKNTSNKYLNISTYQ